MAKDSEGRFFREVQWDIFAVKVAKHVREYTIPQYGDFPDDKVSNYTMADCLREIAKYCHRNVQGTNMRGGIEAKRDMVKIAHYACLALSKMRQEG